MEIRPLADHPDVIPSLANWIFTEWHDDDGRTQSEIETQLHKNLNRDSVPITFVAIRDSKVVGTVSVDISDLPSYDHLLSPWLASLYVLPDFRRSGVGRALVLHVITFARAKGLANIYLWTWGSISLYEQCGWRRFGTATYSGRPITIMRWTQ